MVGLSSTALASRDPSSRATFCVARRVGDARAYTLPVDDAGLATCSAETPAHAGKSAQQYVVGLRRYAAAGGTTRSPRRPRPRGSRRRWGAMPSTLPAGPRPNARSWDLSESVAGTRQQQSF